MEEKKMYRLLGADGKEYLSDTPGTLGGIREGGSHRENIYGRLDCGSALAHIRRSPETFRAKQVFFADERTALAAGFRPCGNCMRTQLKEYNADPAAYRAKFGL